MKDIIKSAVALSIINVFIKLLGPARNILFAHKFGISRKLDAYFISQNFIDVVIAIFTFTIIIIAVPAFIEELSEKEKKDNGFGLAIDSFINQNILLAIILTVLFFALSGPIASIIPGFSNSSAQKDLSHLLAIFSFVFLFSIPFTAITGFFYSMNRFILPSFLKALPVVSVILSIAVFSGFLDIYSIPSGILFGNFIISVFLFGAYIKSRRGYYFTIKNVKIIRKIKNLIIPTIIFSAGGYLNLLVDQLLTSRIKDGAVSILSYAQFFIMMTFTLITLPLITAIFPKMSRNNVLKGNKSLIDITSKGFIVLTTVMIPFILLILFFRVSIIDLFYNHGKFDFLAVGETARVLLAYGPAMLFLSLNNLIQRIFFTKRAMLSLMFLTIGSISLNIILDFYFSSLFSIPGIALATSVNDILYFFLILFVLHRRYNIHFLSNIKKELLQILFSASLMATTLFIVLAVFPFTRSDSKINLFFSLLFYSGLGFIVYILSMTVIFKNNIFKSILAKNE
ncbi:MAG: polysaccharide biosynthesis C-terminal domain-containing protein [Candidatus Aminicenantes bacterium]|nr:polysaccharide biosynthesis C-terminal domain-containing protein [Candidatus Aminicenantes bacterium]